MDDRDEIRINVAPAKRTMRLFGQGLLMGAGVGLSLVYILVGLVVAVLFASFMWWLSEQAYEVTWLLGFPIRIVAVLSAISVLFALIGAAFQVVFVLGFSLWTVASAPFRRNI